MCCFSQKHFKNIYNLELSCCLSHEALSAIILVLVYKFLSAINLTKLYLFYHFLASQLGSSVKCTSPDSTLSTP